MILQFAGAETYVEVTVCGKPCEVVGVPKVLVDAGPTGPTGPSNRKWVARPDQHTTN